MFESGCVGTRPGKRYGLPAESAFARFRIASARGASGTRWFAPAFMRAPGMVHVLASSISAHVARSTSLVRVAVRIRNSKASLTDSPASASRTERMKEGTCE